MKRMIIETTRKGRGGAGRRRKVADKAAVG